MCIPHTIPITFAVRHKQDNMRLDKDRQRPQLRIQQLQADVARLKDQEAEARRRLQEKLTAHERASAERARELSALKRAGEAARRKVAELEEENRKQRWVGAGVRTGCINSGHCLVMRRPAAAAAAAATAVATEVAAAMAAAITTLIPHQPSYVPHVHASRAALTNRWKPPLHCIAPQSHILC